MKAHDRPDGRIRPRRAALVAAPVAATVALVAPASGAVCPDPFAFLGPSITVSGRDRQRIDAGQPVVRILPGEGREIAVVGIVAVDFGADRLLAWMRRIEDLKKSENVPAVGRFSDSPALSDLAAHVLEDKDLDSLRKCRVGNCDLKLTADEIARVPAALASAGADWKTAAQDLIRKMMLERVQQYRSSGLEAIGIYADGHTDQPLTEIAQKLVDRSPYLVERTPGLVTYLMRYPHASLPRSEEFVYWSTDRFGGRPVTSATHVVIHQPQGEGMPEAIVAGRQLFATHYQNGSLSLTLLLRGCPGPPHYLAYISRSEVDVIRGLMGWLTRRIIQGRVENEAAELLNGLRTRLSKPVGNSVDSRNAL